jgi:isochorismate hydrolase
VLKGNIIHRLMASGGYTHPCVHATVFDAYTYDIVPGIIIDAVISYLPGENALLIYRMRRKGYPMCLPDENKGGP